MYQPNYTYGDYAFLPYSVGCLAAFAWQSDEIRDKYCIKEFGYLREPIEAVVGRLKEPFLCAFSCYIWNYEYNKALAEAIKKEYPDTLILFGGHQISRNLQSIDMLNQDAFFKKYVDFLIFDEGEMPFTELLLSFLHEEKKLDSIPNLAINEEGKWRYTEQKMVIENELPSPYLMGLFDSIVENTTYIFEPTFETNRGCPFSCAYCDWGEYKGRLRQFPMDRIMAEIDWFAEHKTNLLYGADSNFGILERDEEIIDYMLRKKEETGYPQIFRVCYTKNTSDRVFRINKRLNDNNMCKGATLSFQSLNENTLEAIGRKNVSLDFFGELMSKYNEEKIPTYSEIIMGLPEETYSSFCEGINQLIIYGQHTSLNIYLCELLPNSNMASPDYLKRYKIEVAEVKLNQYHCVIDDKEITEMSHIITGNSTMPVQDWKKAFLFSIIVQTFHCLGLSRYIAIFLYQEFSVDYNMFYNRLLDWFLHDMDSIGSQKLDDVINILDSYLKGNGFLGIQKDEFGDVLWPLEEGYYLEILKVRNDFYEEFEKWLLEEYPDMFNNRLGKDVIEYQKALICGPFDEARIVKMNYDLYQYYSEILAGRTYDLQEKQTEYKISPRANFSDWKTFAYETVWYGRKGARNEAIVQEK